MKSLFPKQEWTDFVLAEVKRHGLDQIEVAGLKAFGMDGGAKDWVHLIAAMAKHESSFRPRLTYEEGGHLEGITSVGLMQISQSSTRAYARFGLTEEDRAAIKKATTSNLKDPFFNLMCAITILARWVKTDRIVASEKSPWKGGARYWSVLRRGAKKVKPSLKLSQSKDE